MTHMADADHCYGCGAVELNGLLPIVGIGRDDDETDPGPLRIFPVCAACWLDPAHRLLRSLDMHFHFRADADRALAAAIRLDEISKQGGDLFL